MTKQGQTAESMTRHVTESLVPRELRIRFRGETIIAGHGFHLIAEELQPYMITESWLRISY